MQEFNKKSPYMDYRNSVPSMDLSGFIVKQPTIVDEIPVKSLQEYLIQKKFSTMINMRRLQYCKRSGEYRYGQR